MIYDHAEWRMTLCLQSCTNVEVEGLTLKDSGGDGIYLGKGNPDRPYCKDIRIRDVVCDNHFRQGISVVSAEKLLENCLFKNTWGTAPSAGIDLEPDRPTYKLRDILVRGCTFQDNFGNGIHIFLGTHAPDAADISVRFEHCRVSSDKGGGIRIAGVRPDGSDGCIEFDQCTIENVAQFGLEISHKAATKMAVRFHRCTWRQVACGRPGENPLRFVLKPPAAVQQNGGVAFVDCRLEDDQDRPFLTLREEGDSAALVDLTGAIAVRNPYGAVMDLGTHTSEVDLQVLKARCYTKA